MLKPRSYRASRALGSGAPERPTGRPIVSRDAALSYTSPMPRLLTFFATVLLAVGVSLAVYVGLHILVAPPVPTADPAADQRLPDPFAVEPKRLARTESLGIRGRIMEAAANVRKGTLSIDGFVNPQVLPAEVVLLRLSGSAPPSAETYLWRANADGTGAYRFTDLLPGDYQLRLLRTDSRRTFPAHRLEVQASLRKDLGYAHTDRSLELEFRLADADGQSPLPPSLITISRVRDGNARDPEGRVLAWARCGDDGRVAFKGMPDAALFYRVWVTLPGTASPREFTGKIDRNEKDAPERIVLTL